MQGEEFKKYRTSTWFWTLKFAITPGIYLMVGWLVVLLSFFFFSENLVKFIQFPGIQKWQFESLPKTTLKNLLTKSFEELNLPRAHFIQNGTDLSLSFVLLEVGADLEANYPEWETHVCWDQGVTGRRLGPMRDITSGWPKRLGWDPGGAGSRTCGKG